MPTICPHCRHELTADSEHPTDTRCPNCLYSVFPQLGKRCPACGEWSLATVEFCQTCGSPLPQNDQDSQDTSQDPFFPQYAKARRTLILRFIVGILLIIICAFGLRNYLSDLKEQSKREEELQYLYGFLNEYDSITTSIHGFLRKELGFDAPQSKNSNLPRVPRLEALYAPEVRHFLEQNAIPQYRCLLEQYEQLSPQNKKRLNNPEKLKAYLEYNLVFFQNLLDIIKENDQNLPRSAFPDTPKIKI